jgi:hypothetical protein
VTGANLSLTPDPDYAGNINVGTATASYTYAGDANHTGSSDTKNFTIVKAPSTVTVTCGGPYIYTGLAQAPCTAQATGAGMSPVNVSASLVYANNTKAGAATATASWGGDANHTGNTGSGGFTITKATLTVTADNKSIYFGSSDPAFTFQYSGFVNSETASVIATAPTCTVTVVHTAVGTYPIVCAGGVDNNYAFSYVNGTLTVGAWTLKGFYQPVDMPTPTTLVYNIVKGGSTVPLKFEMFAGSTELTNVANVKSLTYAQTSCSATAITDDIETLATGGTVLRYDSTGGQFIYNWKTPTGAGTCYRATMTALDGSSLVAYFKTK